MSGRILITPNPSLIKRGIIADNDGNEKLQLSVTNIDSTPPFDKGGQGGL